ncbi:Endo-1,3(4)-beta-glucanase 1 [Spatholobus suberectus]|nr:Endo-1,3(4)-beta-glucanase 1 [Spatholobus suberectus]
MPHTTKHFPFLFPQTQSTVLPDPSNFSPNLLSNPLPTNSFFQNFALKNGDQPEYIHPYLVKSSNFSLSLSYPSRFFNSSFIYQVFTPDLTISASQKSHLSHRSHTISSHSDLSVALDIPSSNLRLSHGLSEITSDAFSGIIRIALLPDSDWKHEAVLDRFSSCYPVSGDSWLLKTDPVSVTWHSMRWRREKSRDEVVSALVNDVEGLNSSAITTNSSYFYGKLIARAARLALIAEEVCFLDVISKVRKYLKETIEPWLEGTFNGNGFLYDRKWGGIVTKQGSTDAGADFGFGIYNDHHYHLGYFLYGIAVLAKIDPVWGRKYKPQAYSLMADFMTLSQRSNSNYTRLRCFDLYKLHSWAGGLTEFADGRNQESTSEAVNAYYSAALMGLAYGDTHLVAIGSTLTALEIHAAQMWWHVGAGHKMYEEDFTKENKVVGVLWLTRGTADYGLRLLSGENELVEWTLPALNREGVGEGWKGFVYALQGIYDNEDALQKIKLKWF